MRKLFATSVLLANLIILGCLSCSGISDLGELVLGGHNSCCIITDGDSGSCHDCEVAAEAWTEEAENTLKSNNWEFAQALLVKPFEFPKFSLSIRIPAKAPPFSPYRGNSHLIVKNVVMLS